MYEERNLTAEEIEALSVKDWFLDSSLELHSEGATARNVWDIPVEVATKWKAAFADVSRKGHMEEATLTETDEAFFLYVKFLNQRLNISFRKAYL